MSDVEEAARWYRDELGFEIRHLNRDLDGEEPTNYAVLRQGAVELHLVLAAEVGRASGAGMLVLDVAALDALHSRVAAAGVRILRAVESRPWGVREGWIEDPFGTRLILREPDSQA